MNMLDIAPSLNLGEISWVLWVNDKEQYGQVGYEKIGAHHILLFDRAKTIESLSAYRSKYAVDWGDGLHKFLTNLINKLEKGLEPKKQA